MKKLLLIIALAAFLIPAAPVQAQEGGLGMVKLFEEVDQAVGEVEEARKVYEQVKGLGKPPEEIQQAKEVLEKKETELKETETKLDSSRVEVLAAKSGKSTVEVQAMRDSGMGWGRIAKELGLHPSVVAKGKGKDKGKDKGKSKSKGKGKKK